jgi:6-phosphogluconolactonase
MSFKSEIIIESTPTSMSLRAADIFQAAATECISKKGNYIVALSGGSTPRKTHRRLAQEPYRSKISWSKTHIFWVDERCVPINHPGSNFGAAKQDFLDRLPIPKDHIHTMISHGIPEKDAVRYENKLKSIVQLDETGLPLFDFIFLGIGTDGHTASLFPDKFCFNDSHELVAVVKGGHPNVTRLTLTYPVLNRAECIVFLVSGKNKASIIKAVVGERRNEFPAHRIQPINGKLIWLLDKEAASLLDPVGR